MDGFFDAFVGISNFIRGNLSPEIEEIVINKINKI